MKRIMMMRTQLRLALLCLLVFTIAAGRAGAQEQPPAAPEAPESAEQPQVLDDQPIAYTIREGDTFESIAEKWYGNREFASAIAEANPDVDAQNLVIGAVITLPRIDLGDQLARIEPLPEGEVKILQAVVMKVEGTAQWRPDVQSPWKNAAINDVIATGSEIRTGSDSTLTLRIGMNASVLIDRISRITLPEMIQAGDTLRTRVTMQYGLADVKVDHVGLSNDFEIKTPSATLAVKGTGWRIVWDGIDGFRAFGVPTNRIRAIEIEYINSIKVALTADDASSGQHQLPSLNAFAHTYFLPLAGAVSPEEVPFLTMVVSHGQHLIRDLGLDESFGREGFEGTLQEFTEQGRGGGSGCGCQFEGN